MIRGYMIELSSDSNQYITSRAISARNVNQAIEMAESFMRSRGAHIARVFSQRGTMVACITSDGEICKQSWIAGTSEERG